ncbi:MULTISPECIES: hydroxymethylbilane synthase [Corynebacterium]|uniref:hydroxymethylbilane synthase n=1 Tax=Corynebacterium TaxID=1716 RepID=UPI0008A48D9D|nr:MULTISPECIES: hydroxymethylbilane synthase [Corynebacterium]OFS21283.1 hydroxymethylbilane synthase [Corynebacterium sp. HMSC04H06]WJY88867.1 Porphobilinogen deaminase [Corynebacterium confusum]
MTLKIGTRGSRLATTQAGHVRDWLTANGYSAELHIVTTAGDVNMAPVERIGVGVFTQALREALQAGECDIAVHSFKDLPTAPDERFRLIVPQREDHREALIARDGLALADLPEGARVGTSAPRRISQLKALRPDLDIRPLRGNIETRMGKVTTGELDAVMLAYAGLVRAGYGERATEVFEPETIMPAPAQGALAVEARVDDEEAVAAITTLLDAEAMAQAAGERTVLARLEAGCTAPVAATSHLADGQITVRGGVFALDGARQILAEATGEVERSAQLGAEVSDSLFAQGAAEILGES